MLRTDREVARTAPGRGQRQWSVTSTLLACLPAAFLAGVVLADILTPSPYYRFLASLIVAVPALAAASAGPWGAVAYTLLGVGGSFLIAGLDDRLYTPSFYGALAGLAVVFAISLLPGYQRSRRVQRLAQARSVAETVQRAVMVPIPEQVGHLYTAAAYVAAEEEARIGGDLYEALDTPYGVRLIVGDVRGKGLASVGSAANLLGAFREIAPHAPDLPTLAQRLEESVQRYNARAGAEASDFITATLLCVPPGSVARLLCCGHPGPLLLRAGQVTDIRASRPSLPLGLGELHTAGHHSDMINFDVGDCLLLYTDGVTEARDGDGRFYPLADRVRPWTDSEPEQLVKRIVHDLGDYTGGRLGDDAALLAAQRRADSG